MLFSFPFEAPAPFPPALPFSFPFEAPAPFPPALPFSFPFEAPAPLPPALPPALLFSLPLEALFPCSFDVAASSSVSPESAGATASSSEERAITGLSDASSSEITTADDGSAWVSVNVEPSATLIDVGRDADDSIAISPSPLTDTLPAVSVDSPAKPVTNTRGEPGTSTETIASSPAPDVTTWTAISSTARGSQMIEKPTTEVSDARTGVMMTPSTAPAIRSVTERVLPSTAI